MNLFHLPKGGLCTGLRMGGMNSCSTEADRGGPCEQTRQWSQWRGVERRTPPPPSAHPPSFIILFWAEIEGPWRHPMATFYFETMMTFSLPNMFEGCIY